MVERSVVERAVGSLVKELICAMALTALRALCSPRHPAALRGFGSRVLKPP